MDRTSGELKFSQEGKLILTGEIFDSHNTFLFEAFVDTGSTFGIIITRELADAVCAPDNGPVQINAGAGSVSSEGHKSVVNLKFGQLICRNYPVTIINGTRNLIGVKFLQEAGIIMLVDFNKGRTQGGIITTDRTEAKIFGKVSHCLHSHKLDLSDSKNPCPVCGAISAE